MKLFGDCKEKKPSFFPWGFSVLDKWLQVKHRGGSLDLYFQENSIHKIAIYGLSVLGERLYEELLQGETKISCGIDQNAASIQLEGLEIKTLADELPEVDAVIVTPMSFYEIQKNIYREMGSDVDVISIEDVVEYCLGRLS